MSVDAADRRSGQETASELATGLTVEPLVVRNDWRSLSVPPLGAWTPTRSVTVVVPAYQEQHELDLTLASLSVQTYPSHLMEVVVVDDGSSPPLRLPDVRPEYCRLVTVAEGWGRAAACHTGAAVAEGDVIHWLDSDMMPFHDHVEAQMRWHHAISYAVTLGYKRLVPDELWPTVPHDQLVAAAVERRLASVFDAESTFRHDWVEDLIEKTQGLAEGGSRIFTANVGATAAVGRDLYEAAGGMDPGLHLGEDMELGYRLAQQGAVFVPEPEARSWHLGSTQVMRRGLIVNDYNRPFFAQRMPLLGYLRRAPGPIWEVPMVDLRMVVDDAPYAMVRRAADVLVTRAKPDVRVTLVAPWDTLTRERRPLLDHETFDLNWLHEHYRNDPRIRLVLDMPAATSRAPFVCDWPVTCAPALNSMRLLIERMEQERLGLLHVRVPMPDGAPPATIRIARTAAVQRALRIRAEGRALDEVVGACWGSEWVEGDDFGVTPHTDETASERPTVKRRPLGVRLRRFAGRAVRRLR